MADTRAIPDADFAVIAISKVVLQVIIDAKLATPARIDSLLKTEEDEAKKKQYIAGAGIIGTLRALLPAGSRLQ